MLSKVNNQALPVSGAFLNPDKFLEKFTELFPQLEHEFFKIEREQSYQEPNNPSYVELMKGNHSGAISLLFDGLMHGIDYFRQCATRDLLFTRVRLVELPLTNYLKWEFQSYQVSARCGERILVKDITDERPDSTLKRGCDYVMFDRKTVLSLRYDKEGLLEGSYLIEDPKDVKSYVDYAMLAKKDCMLLAEFEHKFANELVF